jgi:hypothetical protein
VVVKVMRILADNKQLSQRVRTLSAENERLRAELAEIESAVGRTGGNRAPATRRRRTTRRSSARAARRITDPELLEKRRQAAARARAVRAQRLAESRAAAGA